MSIGYGAAGRYGSRNGELGKTERAYDLSNEEPRRRWYGGVPDLADMGDGVREPTPPPPSAEIYEIDPESVAPKPPPPQRGEEWAEQADDGERVTPAPPTHVVHKGELPDSAVVGRYWPGD